MSAADCRIWNMQLSAYDLKPLDEAAIRSLNRDRLQTSSLK